MAASASPISPQTAELIGYGLLLGGAMVVGKLVIDNLVQDRSEAVARKKAAPLAEALKAPPPPKTSKDIKVGFKDVARFLGTCFAVYSMVNDSPTLLGEWTKLVAEGKALVK